MRKSFKFLSVFYVLTVIFILSGCDRPVSSEVEISPPVQNTPSPTVVEVTPQEVKEVEKESDLAIKDFVVPKEGERPVAVMIDNEGTKSLPQGGMNLAQYIYEIIVEGGESRLMPVFWGQNPSMIGPVRSSRHYFIDYAMENDAIYVHFGWSPMAMSDISKFKINNINGVANSGGIFWDITKDRGNWQDSYTSMEKIKGYVEKVKYRTTTDKKLLFLYNEKDTDLASNQKAESINMRYSSAYTSGFTYDLDKKLYFRLRKGKPQMERVTGEQLKAKNIVIQKVSSYTIKGDSSGRQEVNTVGSGDGFYITNGKYIKIKWSKDSRSGQTTYKDEKGEKIVLNKGQTWIQIVPVGGKVTIE